jgi:hypothetical protein
LWEKTTDPIVAGFYLSAPFLFMISLDIHSKKKQTQEEVAKKEIFAKWEKIRH